MSDKEWSIRNYKDDHNFVGRGVPAGEKASLDAALEQVRHNPTLRTEVGYHKGSNDWIVAYSHRDLLAKCAER